MLVSVFVGSIGVGIVLYTRLGSELDFPGNDLTVAVVVSTCAHSHFHVINMNQSHIDVKSSIGPSVHSPAEQIFFRFLWMLLVGDYANCRSVEDSKRKL